MDELTFIRNLDTLMDQFMSQIGGLCIQDFGMLNETLMEITARKTKLETTTQETP